jgi:hypothetical protein
MKASIKELFQEIKKNGIKRHREFADDLDGSSSEQALPDNKEEHLLLRSLKNIVKSDVQLSLGIIAQHMVIDSTSLTYTIWIYFIQILRIITAIIYPQGVALSFTHFGGFTIPFLINLELLILINILMNFFATYKIEGTDKYETDFTKIWTRYFHSNFPYDIFIWLPLGFLAEIHASLSILRLLWLLKIFRIKYFISILDEKYINPILRNYYIKDLEK